jgi:hypothetical protein
MSEKLDPKKAVYLKPGQRRLPSSEPREKQAGSDWVEHKSDVALDEWGVAIRVLLKLGKSS